MGIVPSIGKRGFQTGPSTNAKNAESIERPWSFLLGLITKTLKITGSSSSAGQMLVASDAEGNVEFSSVVPSTTLQLTGQTANSTGTMVASGAATGEWLALVYALCTTASGAGAPTLDVTLSITDNVGAATITAISGLSLAATGRAQGVIALRCSGGGIDYTATINAGAGTPQYALYVDLVRAREA